MTPRTETSPNTVISSERVEGTPVYSTDGNRLGTIDNLMIDKLSGQVCYAVLEFGGILGIGSDRYPVPWSMLDYDTGRQGYVVPLDKKALKDAPRYGEAEAPVDFTDDYGRRISSYYGVGPL